MDLEALQLCYKSGMRGRKVYKGRGVGCVWTKNVGWVEARGDTMRGIKSCLVGYKFFLVIVTTLSLQIVARHCRCCVHTTFFIFLFYFHTIFFYFLFFLPISFCVHTTFPFGCISFFLSAAFHFTFIQLFLSPDIMQWFLFHVFTLFFIFFNFDFTLLFLFFILSSAFHYAFTQLFLSLIFLFWFHTAFLIFYSFFCISLRVHTTYPLSVHLCGDFYFIWVHISFYV